jgi:hypothetical protein
MLILSIFLYPKSSKYFSRKTYSKYSRRVRTKAPPDVARLNTEIPFIQHLDIYSNIYDPDCYWELFLVFGVCAAKMWNSMTISGPTLPDWAERRKFVLSLSPPLPDLEVCIVPDIQPHK